MDLKYFHYISKSKVEAITGQIRPAFHWSKVNPKLQGFGVGLDVNVEREKSTSEIEELVKKTVTVISYLKRQNLIIPLSEADRIDQSQMYRDESDWFHGLYSLQSDVSEHKLTVTYILWRAAGNHILLLLGSPLNILGNREVQQGARYDSSSSQIIDGVLEDTTVTSFVEALHNKSLRSLNESVFVDVKENDQLDLKVNVRSWAQTKRIRAQMNVFRGTALAVFCHEALARLSQRKMEVLFRIYQSLPVSRAVIPYDSLYIGSPLYTAFS